MRILRFWCLLCACWVIPALHAVAATQATAGTTEISSRVVALQDAVNKRDAAAAGALWSTDATYIDEYGNRYAGRDTIQRMFADLFASHPKSSVQLDATSVRLINKDVAAVDGVVKVGSTSTNRFALTLVKDGANWLIASGHETAMFAQPAGNPLNNLQWLIGNWHAVRDASRVDMTAEWIGDKSFILCRYVSNSDPKSRKVDGQVIGWDPVQNKPISWHFDANGGFGQGVWTKKGNSWSIDVVGTARDGRTTSATNLIVPVDKDSFTWQSVHRRQGGSFYPDTAQLKVERSSTNSRASK